MKYRTAALRVTLVGLLTAGALVSTSLLAAPDKRDNRSPAQQQRAAPPSAQHRPAPPPPSARRPAPPQNAHFDDRHRGLASDYYRRAYVGNRCPEGLSRQGSSCVFVGARAWTQGKVLPHSVIFYDVPQTLLYELPPPPHGYRYVRVGGDILMIAIGTGLVIDAIRDIFHHH
ncbi:MAG: RcnB family protein [Candidatus Accumulibacter sp.]|nr:RcnB family protein [Accumulibacter sp.]